MEDKVIIIKEEERVKKEQKERASHIEMIIRIEMQVGFKTDHLEKKDFQLILILTIENTMKEILNFI